MFVNEKNPYDAAKFVARSTRNSLRVSGLSSAKQPVWLDWAKNCCEKSPFKTLSIAHKYCQKLKWIQSSILELIGLALSEVVGLKLYLLVWFVEVEKSAILEQADKSRSKVLTMKLLPYFILNL